MKKWLKKKLRKWLGIDETDMRMQSVSRKLDMIREHLGSNSRILSDIHMQRGNAVIIIASKIKQDHVTIVDAHFKHVGEYRQIVKQLQLAFGVENREIYYDAPPILQEDAKHW